VEAVSGRLTTRHTTRPVDRVVAAFLLVLLAVGSLWLWIGMPLITLWAVAQIVDSPAQHLTMGLLAVPAGMIVFAPLLFWMNALYLRVTGAVRYVEDEEEEGELLRVRGPLEPLLVWSLIIALVALVAWFIFTGAQAPRSIV
jgi:hypothetical protein